MKKSILIILVFLLAGCGTIISRTPGPMQAEKSEIYNGVKTDLGMVQDGESMGVVAALDIPLSITVDTILLPLDIITWWARYEPPNQKGDCLSCGDQ